MLYLQYPEGSDQQHGGGGCSGENLPVHLTAGLLPGGTEERLRCSEGQQVCREGGEGQARSGDHLPQEKGTVHSNCMRELECIHARHAHLINPHLSSQGWACGTSASVYNCFSNLWISIIIYCINLYFLLNDNFY